MTSRLRLLVYLALCTGLSTIPVNAYNILLAVPIASKSLHNLFTAIGENLVNANHTVTLLTSFPPSFSHPNFSSLNVLGEVPQPKYNVFEMRDITKAIEKFTQEIFFIGGIMWDNEEVKEVWNKRNSFDAFLTPSYANEICMPFLLNYTGHYMIVSTPGVEYSAMSMAGNWLPPSVVPSMILPYDEYMSFFERTVNVIAIPFLYFYTKSFYFSYQQKFMEQKFPEIGSLESYYSRARLTLINGHPALDSPVPLLPSQVEIGTINAKPAKPLPNDLEEFMASSGAHGVIYFSIGSIAESADIPIRAKLEFVEAFRRLPQKVVWKYEGSDLELPPNVLTRAWLPQQDILGHPKTRLFISHCGNLGTQEAKYHGVPVLAVPVAFDQPRNAARMVRKKLALSLEWQTLTAQAIVDAVNELVNDTTYGARLRTISAVLQDQKESPGARAVWWIEYVIRHHGAPHLLYPGKRLHFLQYVSADVLLFIAVCCYVVYRILRSAVVVAVGAWRGRLKETKKKKL
ncbi:UDP-glucosyltransferase 2 [Hyalella azteca]|uniref:UDP-glucosyltransferase 2 n=1 Tax=Hyalella azteca TaxID=294128 RepID=A0A8B7NDA9_HYAAZ|nr:UDP-glucosyltransferase 2 [Hyalella azteca]